MKQRGVRRRHLFVSATAACLALAACGAGAPGPRPPVSRPTPAAPPTTQAAAAATGPIAPLTGLPAPAALVDRPALSVKIDNFSAARPQAGLDDADIVVEALVEGGLTRFFAVYQSHDSPRIEPIRSARPVDGALLRLLNGGIFAYSGAAAGEIAPAQAYSTAFLMSQDDHPQGYSRDPSRSAPQNVESTTQRLYAAAYALGAPKHLPNPVFSYGAPTGGGSPATDAHLAMSSVSTADWHYDHTHGLYLRSEDGTRHLEADGAQVSATNVLVLTVQVVPSGIFDAAHSQDPFVLAYGSGPAVLLRGGLAYHGTWSRPRVSDPLTLTTGNATTTLAPGRTWIELLPAGGALSTG